MNSNNAISPFTLLLSSLAYFSGNLESSQNPYVEIEIPQGRLRGAKSVARDGRVFMEFLGIPYAQPPLGELRFEPPLPPSKWAGTRQATNYGRSCLQYEFLTHFKTGHEDCLNLNVYTNQVNQVENSKVNSLANNNSSPKRRFWQFFSRSSSSSSAANSLNDSGSGHLKPVIVFFHGGVFMSGFTYIYRAKYLMEQDDIVLVTFNYRVNSFGFLNTGDSVVRGNMGLKDQAMVLKWVQQNIAYFGGDPKQVTIMGQSAGAASVHYHLLSSFSSGLFRFAISQSGSALSSWAFSAHPKEQARRLGSSLNCPTENSTALVTCLKSRKAAEILKFHREYSDPAPHPLTIFSPSVEAVQDDQTFLSQAPRVLMEQKLVANRVPWIIGVNAAEGLLTAQYLMKTPARYNQLLRNMKEYLPELLSYASHPNKAEISQKIFTFYFNNISVLNPAEDLLIQQQLTKLYSDYAFFHGVHDSIELMSPLTTVYPYYFTYDGESGLGGIQSRMLGNGLPRILDYVIGAQKKWFDEHSRPDSIRFYGVSHADELIYQFNIPSLADEMTPGSPNYEFSYDFIKLWLSFVKNGRPSTFRNVFWRPNSPEGDDGQDDDGEKPIEYLEIGRMPRMVPEPFFEGVQFWQSLNREYF